MIDAEAALPRERCVRPASALTIMTFERWLHGAIIRFGRPELDQRDRVKPATRLTAAQLGRRCIVERRLKRAKTSGDRGPIAAQADSGPNCSLCNRRSFVYISSAVNR